MICPSNPLISIGPILAVPGVREALRKRRKDVVAVSLDSIEDSANTQKKFPHLTIVSDQKESLAKLNQFGTIGTLGITGLP